MVNVRDGGFHFCGDPGVSLEFMGPIVTSSYDICIYVKRWMTGNDTSLEIPPIFLFACWMPKNPLDWKEEDQTMNENWSLKKKRPKSIRIQAVLLSLSSCPFWVGLTSSLTCVRWLTFLTLEAETLPVPCVVRFLRTRSDSNRERERECPGS